MKIKLLVVAAATVMAGSAMAQSAFEGFYGQLGVGYESTSVKFSGGTVDSTSYSASANNSNSFSGVIGVGGYIPVSSSFLMGVGIEYNPIPSSSANATVTVSGATPDIISYKKKSSYNIFLSPAIVIEKDKLAYAKVGYTGATIQADGNNTNYTGYSLGLGYKQIIDGGLYGFGEFNYAAYSSQIDGPGLTGTNKPSAINVMVGIGYKF